MVWHGLANGRWHRGKLERERAMSGRGSRQGADVARGRRREQRMRGGEMAGHMVGKRRQGSLAVIQNRRGNG